MDHGLKAPSPNTAAEIPSFFRASLGAVLGSGAWYREVLVRIPEIHGCRVPSWQVVGLLGGIHGPSTCSRTVESMPELY